MKASYLIPFEGPNLFASLFKIYKIYQMVMGLFASGSQLCDAGVSSNFEKKLCRPWIGFCGKEQRQTSHKSQTQRPKPKKEVVLERPRPS